jgi:hypothetical protein
MDYKGEWGGGGPGHSWALKWHFHKIANYFSFELLKKKIWANFQRIIELFNPNCNKFSKIWGWDPGSEGLFDPWIQDPE